MTNNTSRFTLWKYRFLGPTTVHLQLETILWMCQTLFCIACLYDVYPEDAFQPLTQQQQREEGSFTTTSNDTTTISSYLTADVLYVVLVSVWLSRNVVLRWLATWDGGSTSLRPTLQGWWSHLITSYLYAGQTFDRDVAYQQTLLVLATLQQQQHQQQQLLLLQQANNNSFFFFVSNLLPSGWILLARFVPSPLFYLWQMIRISVWFPLTAVKHSTSRVVDLTKLSPRVVVVNRSQYPYPSAWTTASTSTGGGSGSGGKQQPHHLSKKHHHHHHHHRRTSSSGMSDPTTTATASTSSWGFGALGSWITSLQRLVRWIVQTLTCLVVWTIHVMADYGPTLSFLLPVGTVFLFMYQFYLAHHHHPMEGDAAFSKIPSLHHRMTEVMRDGGASEQGDDEAAMAFGYYVRRDPPTWWQVWLLGIASVGTLSSLFFYARIVYPLPDLVAGGNVRRDFRRLRHAAPVRLTLWQSLFKSRPPSSALATGTVGSIKLGKGSVAGGAAGSVNVLISGPDAGGSSGGGGGGGSAGGGTSGGGSGAGGAGSGTASYSGVDGFPDSTWPERARPLVTTSRSRLYSTIRLLRVLEGILLCAILPRIRYICRALQHCPNGEDILSLKRILYPVGIASPLRTDVDSDMVRSWTWDQSLWVIWSLSGLVAVIVNLLLAQTVMHSKSYLAIMAFVSTEWEEETSQGDSSSTPSAWDPRRRYKKGDLVLYPPTGKRRKVYRAATNSPESKPSDFRPTWKDEAFKYELGHPSTSALIAECSRTQWKLTAAHLAMYTLLVMTGYRTDGIFLNVLAQLLAAYTLASVGMPNRTATQRLAAEISKDI